VAWVLAELFRRIDLFMFHPERVPDYVPWAVPPFFSNSDEQTLMNDVVISAVMEIPYYVGSTAQLEVRGAGGRGEEREGCRCGYEGGDEAGR
jgi:hypothetical protein